MNNTYSICSLPPPAKELKLVVTIPVKNEADYIISCLEALKNQKLQPDQSMNNYEILILINHSCDQTLYLCKEFQNRNPELQFHILVTFSDSIHTVGAARKLLMDIAASRLKQPHFLIAMTDADTVATEYWIAQLLKYTTRDLDLICGEILVDTEGLEPFAQAMFAEKERYLQYRSRLEAQLLPEAHDPWPRHAAQSGPNMTIKKSAYQKIGGMPPLSCLEDIALHRAVVHNNLRIKHALDLPVRTSARLESRVPKGFGHELRSWSYIRPEAYVYAVEGLRKLLVRLEAFQLVCRAYDENYNRNARQIGDQLKLPVEVIIQLFNSKNNFQSMNMTLFTILEKHRPWQQAYPNIDVRQANKEIQSYFQNRVTAAPIILVHKLRQCWS